MTGQQLTEGEKIIYDMIESAARGGRVCPSNLDMEMALNCNSSSTAPTIVKALEQKGYIKVSRFQRAREVMIVTTGYRTARCPLQKTDRPHVPRGEGAK